MTIDKYTPVDATPAHTSRVGPVYVAVLALAAALALFSPDTLLQTATFNDNLAPSAKTALTTVAGWSDSLGLAGVRRTLDGWATGLDHTGVVLKKQRQASPGADAKNGTKKPPPEPTVPPGERWQAYQDEGRAHNVLIVGASSIQYAIGTELERELRDGYDVEVHRKGKVATGLTRPDVFDWPAEIKRLQEEYQPDIVVGQFGGNDGQNILDPQNKPHNVYTEGWEQEYGRRLTELTTDIASRGARFIILGMPVMRSDSFTKKVHWLNDITKRFVEDAGGTYVDITDLSVDDQGVYQPSVRFGGSSGRMRMDDGIHFTRLGGQYVAWHLAHKLEREMVLVPKTPEVVEGEPVVAPPATAYRFDVPSTVREPTPMLAFVPRDVPTEGLPVWYLLHGAYDDWTAWSNHAHDDLQRLAADHGVIIVTPDGEPFGYWLDGTADPSHRIATWFTDALIPFVDGRLPSNGVRAISGLSMGGHGALTLAMSNPGMFQAATSMSGAVDLTVSNRSELADWLGDKATHLADWEAKSAIHQMADNPARARELALMLSCGEADKNWWEANQRLHQLLDVHGVPHTWDPQPGGHTWDVWLAALPKHAAFVAGVVAPVAVVAPEVPVKPEGPPDPNKNGE